MSHPAISAGATVLTTREVAKSLRSRLPETCDVIGSGETDVDLSRAINELRSRGHDVVLTEGGPHLMGGLIKQRLLDEVFLTIAPVVAGGDAGERLGMVAGVEFLPDMGAWGKLLSCRRHSDYLFLRYGLR